MRFLKPLDWLDGITLLFHPVVIDHLPLGAPREVHTRIDAGELGGKIVLLPWLGT
jgi:hypothetical protein